MAQVTVRPTDQEPYTAVTSASGGWCPTCRAVATSQCPHLRIGARARRRMAAKEARRLGKTQ